MSPKKELRIFTDGACRGNPGPGGAGAVLYDGKGKIVGEVSEYLGTTTNNQAEYAALIRALEEAKKLKGTDLTICADSQLLVRQLQGRYRVKHPGLIPLFRKIRELLNSFDQTTIKHVYREENTEADRLANEAIDNVL